MPSGSDGGDSKAPSWCQRLVRALLDVRSDSDNGNCFTSHLHYQDLDAWYLRSSFAGELDLMERGIDEEIKEVYTHSPIVCSRSECAMM